MGRRQGDNLAERWFRERGYAPFPFQQEAWQAAREGRSGLIHAPTGTGKTYAAWLGAILRWADETRWTGLAPAAASTNEAKRESGRSGKSRIDHEPLRVLWITPLRALANDTVGALREPIDDLDLPWTVELRTGDTSSSIKARQRRTPPTCLVTTPESLSVLLSYAEAPRFFRTVRTIIMDEWHELMSTKRGVQAELGLAAVKAFARDVQTWGLSATMGNLEEAMATLVGMDAAHRERATLIPAQLQKRVDIETLLPDAIERHPWAGHLGASMTDKVVQAIRAARSTLIFTNTRSQAELWFQGLLRRDPQLIGALGLHHGSLERDIRREVEQLLRDGRMQAVVCTSSLDLGVDFAPVDQIIQIGSPKGIARLVQRAGRSGHQPDAVSRVLGVPTNALELVEFAAARDALKAGQIEPRVPLDKPLDVLVQHIVTRALGGGFDADELLAELRTSHAYHDLDEDEYRWALHFLEYGGEALQAYPQYCRIARDEADGRYRVASRQAAYLHRLSIGTITSDAMITVKFQRGRRIGSIEESFISRLKPGDRFVFAGRTLELIRVREMMAEVKTARGKRGAVPRWQGGRSPLSTHLAAAVRKKLTEAKAGRFDGPELETVRPLLELQAESSVIPGEDELLIETATSRDGHHVFLYPMEGRLVHEGLAALLAWRITAERATSISCSGTDYGIELLSRHPLPTDEATWRTLLAEGDLLADLLACVNSTELARRHFREIARIAGLVVPGFPGQQKAARHLQASSNLFFEVFNEFDPDNRLLGQARREVLDRELEVRRLREALQRSGGKKLVIVATRPFTPMAFPIWADRIRSQYVSSEKWSERVREMLERVEVKASG